MQIIIAGMRGKRSLTKVYSKIQIRYRKNKGSLI